MNIFSSQELYNFSRVGILVISEFSLLCGIFVGKVVN